MTKFGQVVHYNDISHMVTVRFDRPDACKKCGACGSKSQTGTIILKADCRVGEWVRVEFPEGRFLQATAIAYVVPLVGLLSGIAAGWLLGGGQDGLTVLGAFIGLLLSVGAISLVNRRISGRPEWTPRITAVYADHPSVEEIGCHAE